MQRTTDRAIRAANFLGGYGFNIPAFEIHTPDGRRWMVSTTDPKGPRLYEYIDDETGETREHDAVDGVWTLPDIREYLRGCASDDLGNKVQVADGCPNCGNRNADTLVWDDETDLVACKCGNVFKPSAAAPAAAGK